MAKVVYNACYGGFGLSEKAIRRYAEIKGITLYQETDPKFSNIELATWWTVPPEDRTGIVDSKNWNSHSVEERRASNDRYRQFTFRPNDLDREDPILVQVIEELGDAANGEYAKLRIEEIPDGTLYRIDEYDGNEAVETRDSVDWKMAGFKKICPS
jgi:hypothetical protein